LRDILASEDYQAARSLSKLVFALGPDVAGKVHFCDIAKAPHLLIAGMTGAGKSMLLNVLLASLLTQATPEEVRLLMIDPKLVELSVYNGIPHLLQPVVTDPEQAAPLLDKALAVMEQRYQLFATLGVRNLEGYRQARLSNARLENLPAIAIVVDELADLMITAPKELEEKICRLAQKARAVGIHLVLATQRPSVDVITGLIKANIPTRIALTVSSAVDSRTIIDKGGAELLLGRGDLLYLPSDTTNPVRIQGAFMTDQDAKALVDYWKQAEVGDEIWSDQDHEEEPPPSMGAENADEALMAKIIAEVLPGRQTLSISFIQNTYQTAYRRAARIMSMLEERGYVSAPEGVRGERRVLLVQQEEATADESDH
jgi:DNA segregation ATPase FtsK/SpoIIIE-like protein